MSEKLLTKTNNEQFDSAATRDLDPWSDVSTDREKVVSHAEGQELILKHRSFGKKVLDKVMRRAPGVASVHDNEFTRSIIEQGRDGWGQVPDHIMDTARKVRNDQERQKTKVGREENARRDAVKQQIHDDKYPGQSTDW